MRMRKRKRELRTIVYKIRSLFAHKKFTHSNDLMSMSIMMIAYKVVIVWRPDGWRTSFGSIFTLRLWLLLLLLLRLNQVEKTSTSSAYTTTEDIWHYVLVLFTFRMPHWQSIYWTCFLLLLVAYFTQNWILFRFPLISGAILIILIVTTIKVSYDYSSQPKCDVISFLFNDFVCFPTTVTLPFIQNDIE